MKKLNEKYMARIQRMTYNKILRKSKEAAKWRFDFLRSLGTFSGKNINSQIREIVY